MPRCLSMPNLLAALFFSAAAGIGAGVGITAVRQPGSSLDTSLQNEADHAVRQAAAWLAAHQNADGSWGASNRVRLTSITLTALTAARQPDQTEVTSRAALWLDSSQATNRIDDLETHAWRLIALVQVLPEGPARSSLLVRFAKAAQTAESNATADARRLWREALFATGFGADPFAAPDATLNVEYLATVWPPKLTADNATAWRTAHLINRSGKGQLVRDNTPLDWRRDLAQQVINAQRRDPSSGGYWDAPDADAKISETAFALLALLEL